MAAKNKRVDAYIEKSAEFAQPILRYFREVVHEACPEAEEEMKWSFPHFMYKGMFCAMAAFKEHCAFSFWKGSLLFEGKERDGMGHLGRVTSIKDLPSKNVLIGYIREAKRLNHEGVAVERSRKPKAKKELVVPSYFLAAVKKNNRAFAAFEAFSYSHKKEYVEWVDEAKTEATRERRLATTVEWLAEGKSRNWKYERC